MAQQLQDIGTEGACTPPNEMDRRRIERSLRDRKRYRYVQPSVVAEEGGYRVQSPCCSRNVDPEGGVIDIALIRAQGGTNPWVLYRRDHRAQRWVLHARYARLVDLLELLKVDPERLFWQ